MAEAYAVSTLNITVDHDGDGLSLDYDGELMRHIQLLVVRSFKRWVAGFKNRFNNNVFPATPRTLVGTMVLLVVPGLLGVELERGWGQWWGESWVLGWCPVPLLRWLLGTSLVGTMVWFSAVQALRLSLTLLFSYKGYMFEARGKPSHLTKLWFKAVGLVSTNKPLLQSYQGALPKLPVPALGDTLDRHLRSLRPILSDEEFGRTAKASSDFRANLGPRLQRWLVLKSWVTPNYVSDWWEEFVYLRGRYPLPCNSNVYGMDPLLYKPTENQAARAASLTYAALTFRRLIKHQKLEPVMMAGIPLCSAQYHRLFNTTRIPGMEKDVLKTWDVSNHVAVHHRGIWWKLPVRNKAGLLSPAELQHSYRRILEGDGRAATEGEARLAAFTAGSRVPWAKARKEFFHRGINRRSLTTIESAAFVVSLEEDRPGYDAKDPTVLDRWAKSLLHGNGQDRWYDKSLCFSVHANARSGANLEHSWGDAPVSGHLMEYLVWFETTLKYNSAGEVAGEMREVPPVPLRLRWDFGPEVRQAMDVSLAEAKALNDSIQLCVHLFWDYGKGFIKSVGISPDAYLQLAIQTTYHRLEGRFGLTYEAAITRLFLEGRTETIRSVTSDMTAFILAYEDGSGTDRARVRLMRTAAETHAQMCKEASAGMGVDRHLFALYVVARHLEVPAPFLEYAVRDNRWVVSTSQPSYTQTGLLDLRARPELTPSGGGFGPVCEEGYGVAYTFGGEDLVSVHISSKTSCPSTDSAKFRDALAETLRGFRRMLQAVGADKGCNLCGAYRAWHQVPSTVEGRVHAR